MGILLKVTINVIALELNGMNRTVDRRAFLKATGVVAAGTGLMGAGGMAWGEDAPNGAPNAAKLGWRLGCQAWTFNKFTLFEAMDKTSSLGLHYLEAFPHGQKISADNAEVFGPKLSANSRKDVKKRLEDKGLRLVNMGVGPYDREAFEFAKHMGIETLVSEPPFDAFDAIDKLCDEFQINVALHNHPKPSRYWSPDIVLNTIKNHHKRIGACCDLGHWMRSGIKPVDAVKQLEGRVISFHVKDLNEFDPKAHDVPWGTGRGDLKVTLAEVKRQGIKPVFSMEYEHAFTQKDLEDCVAYFNKVAGELA